MKNNNYKPELDENKNSIVENFRKQKRFGIKRSEGLTPPDLNTQIIGRNDLNRCIICGNSFKRSDVVHKVVKSAKGVRLHLCGDCATGYPTAQDYVKPSIRKLAARGM